MDELLLIETVERYLKGDMTAQEKTFFEEIRKKNPDIDQLVVEHTFLFHELDKQANIKAFKHSLYEVESKLAEEGIISKKQLTGKAKVVFLWKKYKRSIAVAASIAGLVSIVTTASISTYNNKVDNSNIKDLIYEVKKDTDKKIAEFKDSLNQKTSKRNPNPNYRATGFLIDGKGFIVTNAHVVNRLKTIYVENNKGEYFTAQTIYADKNTDLAILKINDTSFKAVYNLPYSINKTNSNLGEQIFTMGYPRNEIVYGEGYLSAKSGNEGDSTAYQLSVSVNPGNSGGPVLNKNGQIIGIITSKNSTADGVVFAAKSKNIYKLLDALKENGDTVSIKLPNNTGLKGLDREQQVKKMEDFVFMVVGN
ncbi:MAG: trypsin-like peptidase domain-containing protein [Chitinophagaceae bacterium]|nr:trypsin-like peptidase domain-containing protein [Chitinophagaceae bacterium]MBK9486567.1 trypsin-like peptidase domain-containing protein [Chitinophagaceae bacterium]MBL0202054.1 trypsin-like peptidase domain-containing protein [Chitinophagaceae bacterium]